MYHNGCKSRCYKTLQVHRHNYWIFSVMSWNKAGKNTTGSCKKIIICKVYPLNKRFVLFFFSSCLLCMYLDVSLKQRVLVFVYRPPFVFFPPVNCWWWPLRKASRWVCLRGCDRPFSQQPFRLETVGLLRLCTMILIKVLLHSGHKSHCASLVPCAHCKKEVRFSDFIRFYELHTGNILS